jgi:drug/metabolite transporter (DMT)-like permease
MPAVFVLIWSTGFVVARYGMPHAPPMGFLSIRFALSIACFALWVWLARVAWRLGPGQWKHLAVTGVLMHAGYLGGVWAAVKLGMGAGVSALIVGLQPVLTAVLIAAMGQLVSARQWLGLAMGFGGLVLVLWPKLGAGLLGPASVTFAVVALLSITSGTLYQKRFCEPVDVRVGNAVQLAAALVVSLPLAVWEFAGLGLHITPTAEFWGAMAWSVLGLTLGGSSLLFLLIQRGAATQVTSLMYLVPPCTALLGWWLFAEPLPWTTLLGMAIVAGAVVLVIRAPSGASSS